MDWHDLSLTRSSRVRAYADAGYPAIVSCGLEEAAICQLVNELRGWAYVCDGYVRRGFTDRADAEIHALDAGESHFVVLDAYGIDDVEAARLAAAVDGS